MRLNTIVGLFGMTLILAACQATPAAAVAARIVEPTPQGRLALQQIVAAALDVDSVALAPDALTTSSVLIVERAAFRDAKGDRVMGRELGTPIQFHLVMQGQRCVLMRQSDGARWNLPHTRCASE